MKTTIDIAAEELKDTMRLTGVKTKRAAVLMALADFNRRRRMAEATRVLGTSDTFMTPDALRKVRQARRPA